VRLNDEPLDSDVLALHTAETTQSATAKASERAYFLMMQNSFASIH